MTIETFASRQVWLAHTTSGIINLLQAATVSGKKYFHLCLAGGSTPRELYTAIAASHECRELSSKMQLHLWQSDERCVHDDSPFSNAIMIMDAFKPAFTGTTRWTNPPFFHRWLCDPRTLTPEDAALQYAREIERSFADNVSAEINSAKIGSTDISSQSFDLCILGLGADGHTASIFSLADALDPAKPLTFPTISPQEPRNRVTMRGSFLKQSGTVFVFASGEEKKAVIEAIRHRKMVYPIEAVLPEQTHVFYLAS